MQIQQQKKEEILFVYSSFKLNIVKNIVKLIKFIQFEEAIS